MSGTFHSLLAFQGLISRGRGFTDRPIGQKKAKARARMKEDQLGRIKSGVLAIIMMSNVFYR
jgi:hypothetical protein